MDCARFPYAVIVDQENYTVSTRLGTRTSKAGFDDMLEFLAKRPKAGRIIQGTGGLRKVRFARPGKGKSGGALVIYYYHNDTKPILLLLIYAKADQDDLTDAQKAQIKKHVNAIIDEFS